MSIPDYQTLMLPVLRVAEDRREHTISEVAEIVSASFRLTEEEQMEMLPSDKQRKLVNRVAWAKTYMAKAGLLESVSRGKFKITSRGAALLKTEPAKIDVSVLNRG
jgi:restriction system protein